MDVLSVDAVSEPGRKQPRPVAPAAGPARTSRVGARLGRLGRRPVVVPTGRIVLAAARAHDRGLRRPGPAWSRTRWHSRLDVLVTPGELWVTGNGGTRCYRVTDMVLASFATSPPGGMRIDFLDGEPLCVTLDDNGAVLDILRHEIWEYEKHLLPDGTDLDWALDVSPAQLAESEALLTAALDLPGGSVGPGASRLERQEMVRRSAELRRAARVDALRRRRRRMLGPDHPDRPAPDRPVVPGA